LPDQIEGLIVRLKAEKPHWGARKIRELLVRRLDGDIRIPAKSTIHADRNHRCSYTIGTICEAICKSFDKKRCNINYLWGMV
ncbi:MAG TPA: helix-turn-helix domain-containing protein, partial [Candidatus Acidoferrales bacterium]|nr:helix-turn-helix domain-containing protein [Candidatus Acidoferrales bacterium]